MQPKWTMLGRVKYKPEIVMDLDTNPTVSHLDKSNTYIYVCYFRNQPAIVALENSVELWSAILDKWSYNPLFSWYQPDKYMEQRRTYCPAVCFLIFDLFDKELNRTHQFSSDRPVHRSQQNHRGAQISLLFLEGTDKLRLICLFYYLLNCTQRHVL